MDNAHRRIGDIAAEIESNTIVEQAKFKLQKSEAILKSIKKDFNLLDDKIQQKKVKKTQSESNLYGGSIKNPKELQDLQLEITSLTRILAELDEKLMEKLVAVDQAEVEVTNLEAKLKEAVSQFETSKSMLAAESNKLENSLRSLNEKRSSLVNQINQELLDRYASLRKSKNGVAIADVQDSSCSACGAHLTASECQQARSSSQLFYCPTCGRIVYGS